MNPSIQSSLSILSTISNWAGGMCEAFKYGLHDADDGSNATTNLVLDNQSAVSHAGSGSSIRRGWEDVPTEGS